MKRQELARALNDGKIEQILEETFTGIPFVFAGRGAEYTTFRGQLAKALKCDAKNISLVGSGRFGFSLAPDKFGRPFHDRSDIDVVIVCSEFFDEAWLELIKYDFKSLTFDSDVADSLREHRRNHVFWGYLEPYNLKTALSSYSQIWFPTFAGLGFFRAVAGRSVKARVYRTWEHAKNYHRYGIRLVAAMKGRG